MNIVILSGGSGNDALVKGLKKIYPKSDIKVLLNLYDNGKSTGVCRAITNTLGVSDARKNHTRMYKAMSDHVDARLLEFYDKRFDFTEGHEAEEIKDLLNKWDLNNFSQYVDRFFDRPISKNYLFKDFNVANIIYSQMYSEEGYEYTNKFFCELLGIDDFTVINSFDNVFINGITKNLKVINDEGKIVEHKDANDPIKNLVYSGDVNFKLNQKAIDCVLNADLLIISTGTFWSSIYPTLDYGNFYRFINESKAKKIWAMNNNEDKDAYGVSSNDFINIFKNLGLDLNDFTILENTDAVDILKQTNEDYNIVYESMGNDNGKHNGTLYARAILKIYFGVNNIDEYDNIIFDFDDTIWARDKKDINVSIDNIKKINNSFGYKSIIISGNSYSSIYKKLSTVFGTDIDKFSIDIWADANSTLFRNNKVIEHINNLSVERYDDYISKFAKEYGINYEKGYAYFKIKPLDNLTRYVMSDYLNNYKFNELGTNDLKALVTGKTTIDIVTKNNSKSEVFKNLNLSGKTLYIGDEIDCGNDKDISNLCDNSINVSDVYETNAFLNLFIGD